MTLPHDPHALRAPDAVPHSDTPAPGAHDCGHAAATTRQPLPASRKVRVQGLQPGVSVPMREIAEAIGRRLKLPVKSISPEEAPAFFGWLGMFAGFDMPASSEQTQKKLGWRPTGPTLIADLEQLQIAGG